MDILLKISSAIRYKKIGIVVVCKKKSGYDISYYHMLKRKSSVDICFASEGLNSFDEIDGSCEKIPTILCIQGAGLVQRMMNGSYSDIKQNIPNINIDEYLIDLDESNQGGKLVALYRKEQVESIIEQEALPRIPVHSVLMGFSGIGKYLQFFSEDVSSFEFEGNSIYFKSNEIQEIRKNTTLDTKEYFFAGKLRKASEILALTAGLNYFTERTWSTFQLLSVIEKIKEYTAERLSTFILYYLGAILFVLLLFNFLLFDHYNTKRNQLEIESSGITMVKNEMNQLQADLKVKREFIKQNNVPENFAFAFYADRLASYVPEGVEFTKLSVCTVINKVKEDKVIGFQNNTLLVFGTVDNSTTFSIFLERINQSLWANKLEKQVYNYNNDSNNADFELEILLKNAID